MALVTSKGVYAVAAIYVLLQYRHTNKALSIEFIAQEANIPKNYLEQILVSLKRAGILQSIRGPHGGYKFNKNPEDILILDIIKSVESDCCSEICRTNNEALVLFWKSVTESLQKILSQSITKLLSYQNPHTYVI